MHFYHTVKAVHKRSVANFSMEVTRAEGKLNPWWQNMKAEVREEKREKMRKEIEDGIARKGERKRKKEVEARKDRERKIREG